MISLVARRWNKFDQGFPSFGGLFFYINRAVMCGCWLSLFYLSALILDAQPVSKGSGQGLPDIQPIDQEQGQALIEQFRRQRLQGDFIFKFNLEHLPYRGAEKRYHGMLMGTWNEDGPLNRMVLWPEGKSRVFEVGLLIQGGEQPAVWKVDAQGQKVAIDTEQLVQPLLDDFIYTPFDILMPFVFWQDFQYEGSRRVRSRRAHLFRMYPPEAFKQAYPGVNCVRLKLDARYNALLGAEVLDDIDARLRVFTVVSFEKVDAQYIVKVIDLIDKISRDKTRMEVVSAAVNVRIPPDMFDPDALEPVIPDVSAYRFESL